MVISTYDLTEVAIQKMLDESRRMITSHNNPAVNRDQELKISTLQNAPRDPRALETLLEKKERQKEKAQKAIETQQLCAEIEMLQFVRYLLLSKEKEKTCLTHVASLHFLFAQNKST